MIHERIVKLIKDSMGVEFLKDVGGEIYNIFPHFVPDGTINPTFSSALVYNLTSTVVSFNLSIHTIQLTLVNKNYGEARRIATMLKNLFNEKTFEDDLSSHLLSTTVPRMLDLDYDKVTGVYSVVVELTVKTVTD